MASIRTYDFTNVTLVVNGHIVNGFDEGDAITLEPREAVYDYNEGADGIGEYTATNKRAQTMGVSLQRTSPSNLVFHELLKSKEDFDVQLIDNNEGSLSWSAPNCRIIQNPTFSSGMEATAQEWEFLIPVVNY